MKIAACTRFRRRARVTAPCADPPRGPLEKRAREGRPRRTALERTTRIRTQLNRTFRLQSFCSCNFASLIRQLTLLTAYADTLRASY